MRLSLKIDDLNRRLLQLEEKNQHLSDNFENFVVNDKIYIREILEKVEKRKSDIPEKQQSALNIPTPSASKNLKTNHNSLNS